jgi:hypothetical protein
MTSEISPLRPLTYSMLVNNIDSGTSKKNKSEFNYINLSKLATNFELDFKYEAPEWLPYGSAPGFLSKSYFKSPPDEAGYCYPPNGPIEKYFECTYCSKGGPGFHSVNCQRPFNTSLVLSDEGAEKYPGKEAGTSYLLIVKKSGQTKFVSESIKSEIFYDSVQLIYQNEDFTKCTIRISRNGTINIISAKFDADNLPKLIIDKINKADALTSDFKEIAPKFVFLKDISYKYLLFAQFDLYPSKKEYHIDLAKLNEKLWTNSTYRKKFQGSDVFMVDTPDNIYLVEDYVYNSGNTLSRTNKNTPSILKFVLKPPNNQDIKISFVMYSRGAVQLRLTNAIKGKPPPKPLDNNDLYTAYNFMKEILVRIIQGNQIIIKELLTEKQLLGLNNTIDGKQPQVCMNHLKNQVRPVPYSFYGKCPMPDYVVNPHGVKRPDGKYEPCCVKLFKTGKNMTKTRYNSILVNGYPDEKGEFDNGRIPDPDTETSVYSPGTKTLESRRFKGLKDFSKEDLLKCMEDTGYIEPSNVFTKKPQDYTDFKSEVFKAYHSITGTDSLLFQGNVSLTYETLSKFTQKSYILIPVLNQTIRVFLLFDPQGKSFFININNDVSNSGLPNIPQMSNTLLEGYLNPFKDDFMFQPTDILYFNKTDLTKKPYYNGSRNDRFSNLSTSIGFIQNVNGRLKIQPVFELDILNGSKYYLETLDVSGMLYMPYLDPYKPKKVNKDVILWTDTNKKENLYVALVVKKVGKNTWDVSIDSKRINPVLLPSPIEISIKWSDDNRLSDGDLVLFKVSLNNVTHKLAPGKPLIPVQKIDFNFNDYSDVVSVLQSIQTPIDKSVFAGNKFVAGGLIYTRRGNVLSDPLTVSRVA